MSAGVSPRGVVPEGLSLPAEVSRAALENLLSDEAIRPLDRIAGLQTIAAQLQRSGETHRGGDLGPLLAEIDMVIARLSSAAQQDPGLDPDEGSERAPAEATADAAEVDGDEGDEGGRP